LVDASEAALFVPAAAALVNPAAGALADLPPDAALSKSAATALLGCLGGL